MRRKNMKYIKGVAPAMVLAISTVGAYSQVTNSPTETYTRETYTTEHYVHEPDHDHFFNANEFGISLNTGYVLNPSDAFQNDYSFNLGAGLYYFPCRYFGIEGNVPFYQTKGVSVSEVQFGLIGRLPIGRIAPYIGADAVYAWKALDEWAYIAKVGLEVRFNKKVGIFAEGQYRNNELEHFDWEHGSVALVGGLKLNF